MKAFILSLLIAFVACIPTGWAMANEKPDCPDNSCFSTNIIEEQKQGDCTTYTLEISQDGSCQYALSHFSIEVPCGQIKDVSNSEGWAMEVGTTDPTTGITGIKIDDIKKFGESSTPQSFTVSYTVCGKTCESLAPEKVAYKASTCVHYDRVKGSYQPIIATIVPKNLFCAGSADGAVDLTVTGGKEPYSFSWSNGASTEDIQGLAAGTYSLTVSDATGVMVSQETNISAPAALEVAAVTASAACSENGSISLTVAGGTAPYSYLWSNGETTASIEAAGGTYGVTVKDANGCSLAQSFFIDETNALELSLNGGNSCQDQTLEASISGGTAPFTYLWSTGETTSAITPTSGGTYSLKVTDANNCSATVSKDMVSGAALQLSINASHPTCAYESSGSIDLTVEGGSGEYTLSWSNGSTTEDLESLKAGTYTVSVTDVNGCSASQTVVLSNPQSIFVRHSEIIQPDCNGNTGSISVEAFFGSGSYTYQWSNGETSNSISGLEPDTYQVIVTDENGCTGSRSFVIKSPSQPTVSISGGNCSSTLSATVSGGTAPYTYEWSNGETTSSIEISESGTYEVVVTDANGCSSTESVVAGDPSSAINLMYEVQEPSCTSDSNGNIDLTIAGDLSDYTLSWSNGATTEDLSELAAGTYTVTVSNSSGCTASASINITAPNALLIRPVEITNVSCQGAGGSISVETIFGTAPYTYEWDNGSTGSVLENAEAGYYTVVATDANGCTNQRRFYISEDSAPQVSINPSGCGENQELSAAVSGGKAPYTYNWGGGQTGSSITGGAGSYSVTVTDASGCSSSASIEVKASESPVNVEVSVKQISCAGGKDGGASIQVTGGIAPYTFDWSDGSTGISAENLKAGLYSVKVTDASGCSDMVAFSVMEPKALGITAVAENNLGCGEPSGSINVQVTGGTAPYLYNWNNGAQTAEISNLSAGVYTLMVEDAKGCLAIRSFKIENIGGGTAPVATMENCGDAVICRGTSASLPVYFTGEGPFTFSYSDGRQEYAVTTSANPYMLEVQPQTNTTYQLTSLNNSCGEGMVGGQVNIQVSDCNKARICEDGCFSAQVVKKEITGTCETVTLQVFSDGDCRYALSHFSVAVGCGRVTSASNSSGWPMELNSLDPTTGLYGIKVDEIKNFGEGSQPQSFTVTYTICSEDTNCQENFNSSCGPLVAYKAGTCVYYDKATEGELQEVPQLAGHAIVEVNPEFELYPNPYEKGQVLNLKVNELTEKGTVKLTIRTFAGVIIYKGNHEVSPGSNHISLVVPEMPSGTFVVSLEVQGHTLHKQLYVL